MLSERWDTEYKEFAKKEDSKVVMISAKIEEELSMLDEDDKNMFLEDLGVKESGLDKLVREKSGRRISPLAF